MSHILIIVVILLLFFKNKKPQARKAAAKPKNKAQAAKFMRKAMKPYAGDGWRIKAQNTPSKNLKDIK